MNVARILHNIEAQGVTIRLVQGKLKLVGKSKSVANVLELAKQHKDIIIHELTGGPTGSPISIPPAMAEDLLCCGYYLPEWTPLGCRAFLAQLQAEWPTFRVNGWHGLTMPECWPVVLMDAVQSIYVLSVQDHNKQLTQARRTTK